MENFEEVHDKIIEMIWNAMKRGENKTALSYRFFNNNNALLAYIIDKLVNENFKLRLYETKMEIRWSE